MYWAPLLAYGFMKGQAFVGAEEYSGAAMPVSGTTVTWLDYPFQDFLEDGLVAVGCLVQQACRVGPVVLPLLAPQGLQESNQADKALGSLES